MIRDTAPIRPGEEVDAATLEKYMRDRMPEDSLPEPDRSAPIEIEQFPGGHSNLTYLVRFGSREFVMRRPPVGPVAPTAHDMPREFRILSMVHPVFPLAPRPYVVCQDTSLLGVPFYIMERRRGLIVRREMPDVLEQDVPLRRDVSRTMIDTLAALHSVDIEATGIVNIGKPAGFVERQIRGWTERWERSKTEDAPQMTTLSRWLLENLPEPAGASLVHNDYKLDNVMLDPDDPRRVVAILDWEMCTVGDPLVDLGLLLCYWPEARDPEDRKESISSVTTLPGWMTRRELVARYAELTGRDVSLIHFYEAFALFKVAVVVQQIFYRFHVGQTRDTRFADFGRRALGLLQIAWNIARKIGQTAES